ncbi:MAG: metal ABC transporter solute-binding protein, Zn/Mn family [Nodosilinea sp.]
MAFGRIQAKLRPAAFWRWALVVMAIVPNAGCTTHPSTPTATGRLVVVTTFVPITNFTQAVAGNRAEVTQLLPDNVGPHDYQARPEDAGKLARADVLVKNGLGMEDFLTELIQNASRPKLRVVDSSQGITTGIVGTAGQQQGKNPGLTHQHQGQPNPHIYLDPKRAMQQVANIRDGLIAADPAGKAIYEANAAAYIGRLQQLDRQFTSQLQPFAGKTFVTYHDFAAYFAQSYHLKTQFLVDIPEQNPAPGDIQRVMAAVRQSDLKTLLSEPQAAAGQFSALAKDLNIQVSRFDSLETSGPSGNQPDYYLGVMAENVRNLVQAFSGLSPQAVQPQTADQGLLTLWMARQDPNPALALIKLWNFSGPEPPYWVPGLAHPLEETWG